MDYATAVSKGLLLMTLMYTTDSPASPFLSPSALSQWGYSPNDFRLPCSPSLHHVQQSLGIDPAHNVPVGHSHLDSSAATGIYVPVTWAKFNTVINAVGGMLAAVDNESPTQLRLRRQDARALPELRFWSDVAFLQWMAVTQDCCCCGDGGGADLQYVVRLGITNASTVAVIRQILERSGGREDGGQRAGWEDVTWEVQRDEEAVAALLGTPNGSGVARLLIHHKRQLGHKAVQWVRLVGCGDGEPSLVFKIGHVHEGEVHGGSGDIGQETHRGLGDGLEHAVDGAENG